MTPQRPLELVNASIACGNACQMRDKFLEAGDGETVRRMDDVCDWLSEHYSQLYTMWQKLGGTSNIDSLTFTDASEPDYDAQAEWALDQKFGEPVHS